MSKEKEKIKELLKELQAGEEIDELREEFKDLLQEISPQEIPSIEQELVKEGVKPAEIAEMCDIHLEIFRESVQSKFELGEISEGHPLRTLYQENGKITKDAELLNLKASSLKEAVGHEERMEKIKDLGKLVSDFMMMDKTHYVRQEMIIFPHIEKRGIKAVPRVLWRKHNENMEMVKGILDMISEKPEDPERFMEKLQEASQELSESLLDMVFRENNILYPTLEELLAEEEWIAIKEQEPEVGYYKVEPGDDWDPDGSPKYPYEVSEEISEERLEALPGGIKSILGDQKLEPDRYLLKKSKDKELDTGFLNLTEINALLANLPVDLTFIDSDNRVRYFSGGERIFPRTRSVLGRPVKFCHPPESVEVVKKILKEFKAGGIDEAEFWIEMGGKFVHIRYFPISDQKGNYLGALEVTQDVTHIRELEGERRILDWVD
ncbi:diguanylate cyclase [candidate division MSBL1 archaeon SCGC-AAA382K21]|uniref:Diguanylate cyclase n=1 Tax=candidate division MSBL1 archaeon SCGC-AAA382K21 TaxID=1698283 RepID=A0A133VKV1_9EURY|nr:diguanylate cyclase [candidate division MSBL1 archaeon SCGC-AAA382K21]